MPKKEVNKKSVGLRPKVFFKPQTWTNRPKGRGIKPSLSNKKTGLQKGKTQKQDDKILYAFLATFFTIIGFIIALAAKKKDKYVMFYARQGIVLFIGYIIAIFLGWIPVIGWAYWILLIIVWVFAWINSLSGEQRNTWIIGDIAKKINI